MSEHSLCGSSSLKKRSKCSASCFEESLTESDNSSSASDRGTRLHHLMEKWAYGELRMDKLPADEVAVLNGCIEMLSEALGDDLHPDGFTLNGGEWFVEKRLECVSTAATCRNDWGTVDLIVLYRKEKRAFIADYKFGGALIDHPLWNTQLQDYACNLWDSKELGLDHSWCVEVTYIQPAARGSYNVQPHHFEPTDLHEIAERLKRIREVCYSDQTTYRVGGACQFCSGRRTCWARRAFLCQFVAQDAITDLDAKTPIELGEILSVAKVAKAEAQRIYDAVKAKMRDGTVIPGFTYNEKMNKINGSPNLKGMKPPEIIIKRTCANVEI